MLERRSFLSGLVGLPLVGGGVTLIGQPTAAAVPVTNKLLDAYDEWLDLERSWLLWQRYGSDVDRFADDFRHARPQVAWVDRKTGKAWTSCRATNLSRFDYSRPSTRAAVVLAAAGVPLT